MQKGTSVNRYRALLKVVEVGSCTRAADILGYTQPALSQMISSLEKEISIILLHRSRYGVRLTPEGERLFPAIQKTVQQYEALRRMEDEIKGLDSGIVRIGTVSSVSCHWLPDIVQKFWADYPNVRLTLHQGDYTSIRDWVQTGSVDLGFVNPVAAKGLETYTLQTDPFVAVFPRGHPLAQKNRVSLRELAEESYLLLEEGCHSEPLEAFRKAGITPHIRIAMHDDYSILSMVERGLGYSLLAELVLRKTAYDVAVLPVEEPILRTLALVMKDRRTLSAAAKTFMDFINAFFEETKGGVVQSCE